MLRSLTCLVLFVASAACSDSTNPPDKPALDGAVLADASSSGDSGPADGGTAADAGTADGSVPVVMIGPEGGQLISADSVLQVVIPPGAVTTPVEVKISVATSTALPSDNVGPAYYVEPEGLVFSQPVLLSINYANFELGTAQPETLQLATFSRGVWATVTSASNDIDNTTLSALVPHFSYWSVTVNTTAPRQQNFDPCLCDEQAWASCCAEFGGAYGFSANPHVCSCGGWGAVSIDFDRCLIARSGHEQGCTTAELDCCEAAGGFVSSHQSKCYCSKISSCGVLGLPPCATIGAQNAVLAELTQCMAATEDCGGDKTLCERYREGASPTVVNGMCVDGWSDAQNCGGPGRACGPGESCSGGRCGCPAPNTGCPGGCVDLGGDRLNCGQCGVSCNAGNYCVNGTCSDQVDCNMTPPRFSESEPNNSPDQATPLPVDLISVECGRDVQTMLGMSCTVDDDWFRFTIPTSEDGKRLRVRFFGEVDGGGGPVVTVSLWAGDTLLEQGAAIPGKVPQVEHVLNSSVDSPSGVYTLSISCNAGLPSLNDGVFYVSVVP